MRTFLVAIGMLLCSIAPAAAQVSIGIGLPGVSIGINLPVYPELVRVPGYPVYYAPGVSSNFFFYDGMYWVYQGDNWYASSWYNGPWGLVAPAAVPYYVLRVPVRYYRRPPSYFHGWRADAPPRWGEHWGNSWEQSHSGWDRWNRSAVPAPAPLPHYQRQYAGNRYPQMEQQQALQSQNYRYQPRDTVVQQHYQAQRVQGAPAPAQPQDQRSAGRPPSSQQGAYPASRGQPPQTAGPNTRTTPTKVQPLPPQASPPVQRPTQQPPHAAPQREQQATRSQGQGQGQKPQAVPGPSQPPGPAAKPQKQQHPPEAAQRGQPSQKSQGRGSAQEQKHGQDQGDQLVRERNK